MAVTNRMLMAAAFEILIEKLHFGKKLSFFYLNLLIYMYLGQENNFGKFPEKRTQGNL